MSDGETKSSTRVLEPPERISEVLFGLVMVLTFTCSVRVVHTGQGEIRHMLFGALGCNVAWGIIDGIFYLFSCLSEKGHNLATVRAVRQARDAKQAHRIIADELPPALVSVMSPAEFDMLRRKLNQLPNPPSRPRLRRDDWMGALGVMLLVFLSTFPPTIPFIFTHDVRLALRLSNLVAIVMLFWCGYALGHYAGFQPWKAGVTMVVIGAVMVALSIALGG